jgi:hypothetical protein
LPALKQLAVRVSQQNWFFIAGFCLSAYAFKFAYCSAFHLFKQLGFLDFFPTSVFIPGLFIIIETKKQKA